MKIRHVEPADAAGVRDLFSHRETVLGTLGIPFPHERFWKDRIEGLCADRSRVALVAEVDRVLVGLGSLDGDNDSPRRRHAAEVGMVVHPDWHRKGVGSALLEALVDVADNWLNLRRLELTVYADNTAAVKLYEKFGFRVEGTHRGYAFRDGAFADALCMARLRD